VVFHDLAIPGTPANADHLLIGPPGVVLVDSKRYAGQVAQGRDGRVWHNRYPMDRALCAVLLEAEVISSALGVQVRPVVCVHRARVAFGGLSAVPVQLVSAARLLRLLRSAPPLLSGGDVAALVAHARRVLHPAA
jgi:hypothetical protein